MRKLVRMACLVMGLSIFSSANAFATLLSDVTVIPGGPSISGTSVSTTFLPPFPPVPGTFFMNGIVTGDSVPAVNLTGSSIFISSSFDPGLGFLAAGSSLTVSNFGILLEGTLMDSALGSSLIAFLFTVDGGQTDVVSAFSSGFVRVALAGAFGGDPFGTFGTSTFNPLVPLEISVQAVSLPTTVPEPASLGLLLGGMGLLSLVRIGRRQRCKASVA